MPKIIHMREPSSTQTYSPAYAEALGSKDSRDERIAELVAARYSDKAIALDLAESVFWVRRRIKKIGRKIHTQGKPREKIAAAYAAHRSLSSQAST